MSKFLGGRTGAGFEPLSADGKSVHSSSGLGPLPVPVASKATRGIAVVPGASLHSTIDTASVPQGWETQP